MMDSPDFTAEPYVQWWYGYDIPDDAKERMVATDGACGLSWDDSIVTGITPAPSGRCPFTEVM
jgi:hypothetical protein